MTAASTDLLHEIERLVDETREVVRTRRAPRAVWSPALPGLTRVPPRAPACSEGADRHRDPPAVAEDVAAFTRPRAGPPGLAVVIVGARRPSTVYLEQILKRCAKVGIEAASSRSRARRRGRVVESIATLNADPGSTGSSSRCRCRRRSGCATVIDTIDPGQGHRRDPPAQRRADALGYDGFLPATAHAAVEILRRSGIEIEGTGRGRRPVANVVGMPAAFLLVGRTPPSPSATADARPAAHVAARRDRRRRRRAPGLVTGAMLKPGAVVVDVGINVVDGKIVGDVDFESASRVASAITPVPGGVGPLTNALLLTHLIRAAERRRPRRPRRRRSQPGPAIR